jgi:hypothetical protein
MNLTNVYAFNESGLMRCADPVCICYIDMFQLAVIFIMDVIVWELLKFMFRKEIKQIRGYLDRKLNKPPLEK